MTADTNREQKAMNDWYVAMTQPRHEKAVANRLPAFGVECFLPIYEVVRRWKDRKKIVRLPLFPGYVFTRFVANEKLAVVSDPGVVGIISFGGEFASISDSQVSALRISIERRLRMEPYPYLPTGSRVRIRNGAFAGVEGTLIKSKNRYTLILSIDLIQRSVRVEVEAPDVVPC